MTKHAWRVRASAPTEPKQPVQCRAAVVPSCSNPLKKPPPCFVPGQRAPRTAGVLPAADSPVPCQFSNLSGVTDGALNWATRWLPPTQYYHWLSVTVCWFAAPIFALGQPAGGPAATESAGKAERESHAYGEVVFGQASAWTTDGAWDGHKQV